MALDLDRLRQEYEDADARAVGLSGEYQGKVDAEVTARWQELKAQYRDQIVEANEQARTAQKAYADAEALNALLDRPDGRTVANTIVQSGGFSQEQVDEAFGTEE